MNRQTAPGCLSRRQAVQGAGVASPVLLAGCGSLHIRFPFQTEQRARASRMGYLQVGSPKLRSQDQAFRQALQDLGQVDGQSIVIEYRFTNEDGQIPALAAGLVNLELDPIVVGILAAAQAFQETTSTIPIVMAPVMIRLGPGSLPASPGLEATSRA